MKRFKIFFNIPAFIAVALFINANIEAQEIQLTTADKPFVFKLADGKDDSITEPSAVEVIDKAGKYLLVADDKYDKATKSHLRIVEAANGNLVRYLKIEKAPNKAKWEALARDGEDFYIIGSHSVKLDPKDSDAELVAKLGERSHLFQFRLKDTNDISKIDIDQASVKELDIKDSLTKMKIYDANPKAENAKAKVEGLGFRTNEGRKELIIGLREPSDSMRIYSAGLSGDAKLRLKPLFNFEAGKIGAVPLKLSSIEYIPSLNGFLVLTSTEDETNAFAGNALWFISDGAVKAASTENLKPVKAQIVWLFGVGTKAEGLCVLPDSTNAGIRLALVYDNDAEDTKKLGTMQLIELSVKAK